MYNVVNIQASPFDWIFFIIAGNKDNYKVSDELEILSDPTMDWGVSCPCQLKKIFYLVENYPDFDDLLALR